MSEAENESGKGTKQEWVKATGARVCIVLEGV